VVTSPAIGRQWWAVRGQGAFEAPWPSRSNPQPLAVSGTTDMASATLDALNKGAFKRLPQHATFVDPRPSGWCAGLIDLLRGDVDCYFAECCQVWAHAPWILLVEEAGGRFTNPVGGTSGDQNGGLYSNVGLHQELLATLGYPGPD
jgi:histidinol-phosphatase